MAESEDGETHPKRLLFKLTLNKQQAMSDSGDSDTCDDIGTNPQVTAKSVSKCQQVTAGGSKALPQETAGSCEKVTSDGGSDKSQIVTEGGDKCPQTIGENSNEIYKQETAENESQMSENEVDTNELKDSMADQCKSSAGGKDETSKFEDEYPKTVMKKESEKDQLRIMENGEEPHTSTEAGEDPQPMLQKVTNGQKVNEMTETMQKVLGESTEDRNKMVDENVEEKKKMVADWVDQNGLPHQQPFSSADDDSADEEGAKSGEIEGYQQRRIILVGKAGNGKSSTGNTILGEELFHNKQSLSSVTQECKQHSMYRLDVEREYTLVDTPGLFDTDQPFGARALDIQKALEVCPNPHVFLIVLRPDTRYTQEERLTIDMLRVVFGEDFLDHAVLVFTRGADFKSDKDLDLYLRDNEAVVNLKNECKNRVVRIENNALIDKTTRDTLTNELFDMIENISDEGAKYYQYKFLSIHQRCLEEHLKKRRPESSLGEDLQDIVEALGHQIGKERWRGYLLGGLAGAAGLAAIGSVAMAAPVALAGKALLAGTPVVVKGAVGVAGVAAIYAKDVVAPAGANLYRGTVAAVSSKFWAFNSWLDKQMADSCGETPDDDEPYAVAYEESRDKSPDTSRDTSRDGPLEKSSRGVTSDELEDSMEISQQTTQKLKSD